MNSQEYIVLVYKNLKGELSTGEFDEFNKITAHDSKLAEVRLDIEDVWDISGDEQQVVSSNETDQLLKKLTNTNSTSQSKKTKVFTLQRVLSSIAAIFLLALGVTWLMKADNTIYNSAGLYVLEDNSTVNLREGSQLEVSAFDSKSRSVKLTGEAYFDIATDSNRPFKVTTDNVTVEVLGTQFLVKNIGVETIIDLKEGSIKTIDNKSSKTEILTAGMKARHTGDGNIDIISKYNNLSSWRDGTYQYKNIKLGEVLEELGLIHSTTISTTDPILYDCVLNGILVGSNITDVLSRIAQKFNMDIKQDGSKWILAGGKCN